MRILINQTTRMGDVLQTSPLVRLLRRKYPTAHLAMMVRGMGRIIAERHPDLNEVIVYNEDTLYLDLKSRDSNRLLQAYERTKAEIDALRDKHFDVVYNVTHSLASAMQMSLAEIPEAIGAALGEDGQYLLRGAWPKYFFTSVFCRDYNDLNLCDISQRFVDGAPPCHQLLLDIREDDHAEARAVLAAQGIDEGAFLVCMQLGASESNKRWAEHRFAELAQLLRARHDARILLVGVKEEAPLGEAFARIAPDLAVPLYGKTSIPVLAALLSRARVLVTNDTGTMHIAAAAGCPVTLVSVGHVHYRETGPYGAGHCAIEARRATIGRADYVPGADEERERITAEQALLAVETTLALARGESVPPRAEAGPLEAVDLFTTQFAPDGCLQFYPAIRWLPAEKDYVRMAYRAMWLAYLEPGNAGETESVSEMIAHFATPPAQQIDAWCEDLCTVFTGLAAMADGGVDTTSRLIETLQGGRGMNLAKQYVAGLMDLDEAMRVYSEVHAPCRPLIMMARFERDTLEGVDPLRLAAVTQSVYAACAARARLMVEKLTRIAALWALP
jgi:ADP-heptose:LPS heptosyltransferase